MIWRIAALILAPVLSYAQNWEITELAPMPERVTNSAVCEGFSAEGSFVYSFAGIDTSLAHEGIHLRSFRYHVETDTWDTIPNLPDDEGKIAPSASRVGNIIYIIGGYHVAANGNETSSSKVHRFDVAANQYLTDGTDIPIPIDDQVQAVWRDSLIYVVTGWSNTGNVTDVQIYDPSIDSWSVGTSVPVPNYYRVFGASGTIVGDTIYYFGGAGNGGSFPARREVRKGIISPNNPTEIEWSHFEFDEEVKGYRNACTESFGNIHWLGGSDRTYNFDGLAYFGGSVVSPIGRNLTFHHESGIWNSDTTLDLPMDLRGLGDISDSVKYIVGGMWGDQVVSNKTLRLEWRQAPASAQVIEQKDVRLYPNPTHDILRVESENRFDLYQVFGLTGRVVVSGLFSNYIDVHTLRPGQYFLRLISDDTVHHQQFSKH